MIGNYQFPVIFYIVFTKSQNTQKFVNLAMWMQEIRVYNDDINKIHGFSPPTTSINSGLNVNFSTIGNIYGIWNNK